MCEGGGGRAGGGGGEVGRIQNQKQEPHTKMWGITPSKMQVTFRKVYLKNAIISLQFSEGPTLNVTYIFEGADCMGFHKM